MSSPTKIATARLRAVFAIASCVFLCVPRGAEAGSAPILDRLFRNAVEEIPESDATRIELQLVFSAFRDTACRMDPKPADIRPNADQFTAYFLRGGIGVAFMFTSGIYLREPLYQEAVRMAADTNCKLPRTQAIYRNLYRLIQERASRPPVKAEQVSKPETVVKTLETSSRLRKPSRVTFVPPVFNPEDLGSSNRVTVIVEVVVGIGGAVEEVRGANRISLPLPLVEAAIEAVRNWQYVPTVVDGKPVRMRFLESVVFTKS